MNPGHRRLRAPIGVLRELFGEPLYGEDAGEKASRVFFVETPAGEIQVRDWHKPEWGPGAPSCESDTRYVWNVFGPEGAFTKALAAAQG